LILLDYRYWFFCIHYG